MTRLHIAVAARANTQDTAAQTRLAVEYESWRKTYMARATVATAVSGPKTIDNAAKNAEADGAH